MAYDFNKMNKWSQGNALDCNQLWNYTDTGTAVAAIVAANFFDPVNEANPTPVMNIGDLIWIIASDVLGGEYAQVTAISPHVTVAVFNAVLGAGSVGNANLAADAVTTDKILNGTILAADIAANVLTSATLAVNTIQYLKVPMTAAQWNGMYAAPFEILPTPGANKLHVVKQLTLEVDYGGAQFLNGGVYGLQYDTTIHGAGIGASATTAAATALAWAADSIQTIAGAGPTAAATATVNKSVCMSNLTGAFDTGSSTVDVHIWYETVTTTL